MRKLPSHRTKREGARKGRVQGVVPALRPKHGASTSTVSGPTSFTFMAPAYSPTISTFTSYLPGARPASPNVKSWSRGAAISAAKGRRRLRDEAHARTMSTVPAELRTGKDVACVTIIRIAPARYRMDCDNWQAAAKPLRDGVADAFGLRDDAPCFVWKYDQTTRLKEYGVEIRVEVFQ